MASAHEPLEPLGRSRRSKLISIYSLIGLFVFKTRGSSGLSGSCAAELGPILRGVELGKWEARATTTAR